MTAEALPELADRDWMHHATAFANTGFWAVAKRLPAIVREAVAVGWQASKRDTLAFLARLCGWCSAKHCAKAAVKAAAVVDNA